ncbi:MAG: hypothetical protein IIX15_03035 [Clostridia bacterium]|nr:hypothetical protein [Clostridia bacterium]
MKHTVKHCGEQLLLAMSRPEVRHSMHYECGLYKSPDDRVPMASVHVENDCALPLVRLLAMIAAIAVGAMTVRSLLCFFRIKKCKKQCTE